MARVHVVGAGLAGLASAVRLAERGRSVVVHEVAQQAGGRCRSYFDRALGRTIDNGNHLILSGNRSTLAYLRSIGAEKSLIGPQDAVFPFVDLETGARWVVRPNRGRLPWWILAPSRRVPGTRVASYLAAWRLARAGPDDTVADCLDPADPLWRALWDPLARAVLNTPPGAASARLLWQTLRESFAEGGAGCRPLVARDGLSESFVQPALRHLANHGVEVRFGRRLRALALEAERVALLDFGEERLELRPDERVILALPPGQIQALVPDIQVPREAHPIVNGHFWLDRQVELPQRSVLLGVVGGTAQWIFARGRLVSLTVSAAEDLVDEPAEEITERLWAETARALILPASPVPPARIVKEKRATFAQTPSGVRQRPGAATRWSNLWLAGDWTDTGLPATIEGAIRSGQQAAELVG